VETDAITHENAMNKIKHS